jgi:hypothetical protein
MAHTTCSTRRMSFRYPRDRPVAREITGLILERQGFFIGPNCTQGFSMDFFARSDTPFVVFEMPLISVEQARGTLIRRFWMVFLRLSRLQRQQLHGRTVPHRFLPFSCCLFASLTFSAAIQYLYGRDKDGPRRSVLLGI